MKGGKSTVESCKDQQHLTIPEENALVEWIPHLAACWNPPRHAFIRELAQRNPILRAQCSADSFNLPFSWHYVGSALLHWHPELKTTISRTIEAARVKEISKAKSTNGMTNLRRQFRNIKLRSRTCTTWMRPDFPLDVLKLQKLW